MSEYLNLGKGVYTDYLLRAPPSGVFSDDVQYNIMKLVTTGDKVIDFRDWTPPVSLSRKTPRAIRILLEEEQDRLRKRELGAITAQDPKDDKDDMDVEKNDEDSKPTEDDVKGEQAQPKEEFDASLVGQRESNGPYSKKEQDQLTVQRQRRQGRFKKKTRRLFVASDEARRLRQEEWRPWVLKDDDEQLWVGRLDGGKGQNTDINSKHVPKHNDWRPPPNESEAGSSGSASVFFVHGEENSFVVIPSHRFYRFTRNPQYMILNSEEADEEFSHGTSTLGAKWEIKERLGVQRSASPVSYAAPAESGSSGALPPPPEHHRLFNRIERARQRELAENEQPKTSLRVVTGGGDGNTQERDFQEAEFEEEFADDEEGIGIVNDQADEAEQRETEERIQQEMQAAEHQWDQDQADIIDGAIERLSKDKKEMRKILRRRGDKETFYSDDDEDEEDDDDDDDDDNDADPDYNSNAHGSSSGSRRGSPQSPRSPRSPRSPGSRSPVHAPSSPRSAPQRQSISTTPRMSRPRGDSVNSGDTSSTPAKRRKYDSGAASPSTRLLTEADVIAALQRHPDGVSAKDIMMDLRSFLSLPENKKNLTNILKNVARIADRKLFLKKQI